MKFVRRKVTWKKQSVDEYGGEGEYAGSFEEPDFVKIQRAEPGDCVVAKQRATGHWYWFRDDDTLLPWTQLRDHTGACEVHDGGRRSFLTSRMEGPFATELGAKEFGESFAREKVFAVQQDRAAREVAETAHRMLSALLCRGVK